MPAPPTLLCLAYSPFSERARWALDHHRIAYRMRNHQPFVGELWLRRQRRDPDGQRATVPALVSEEGLISDSWRIVEYADRRGAASPLIPATLRAEVRQLAELTDIGLEHGRAGVTLRLLAQPAALDASLPGPCPDWLRPLLRPVSRYGLRWFAAKYDIKATAQDDQRKGLASVLEQMRARLAGGRYLLGDFTYADMAVAGLLQCVQPVNERFVPLSRALRPAWCQPELALRFADLVAWRDGLYAAHREPSAATVS